MSDPTPDKTQSPRDRKSLLKQIVIVGLILAIVLFASREMGIVDASLYRSRTSATHSASQQRSISHSDTRFTRRVEISVAEGNETIYSRAMETATTPVGLMESNGITVPIHGEMHFGPIEGNPYIPLKKQLSLTYSCTLVDATAEADYEYIIKMGGSVDVTISGPCSSRKAVELAKEAAREKVGSFLDSLELKNFDIERKSETE